MLFLSGDDLDAKAEVSALFQDAGFFSIDLGDLITGGEMQQIGGGVGLGAERIGRFVQPKRGNWEVRHQRNRSAPRQR